mmetsp:Transcript_14683/g.44114  ORF Transcript_14683/g.44114 Transcript_14683/m.44114 type:complete len:704 (-) Transcript_14683:218-2329(-)
MRAPQRVRGHAAIRRVDVGARNVRGHVRRHELDGHEVHAVGARVVVVVVRDEVVGVRRAALAIVAAAPRVVVAARPLEVEVLAGLAHDLVRHEVVLHRGVRLHDVAALAAAVHVDDHLVGHALGDGGGVQVRVRRRCGPRSLLDGEGVAAVLEGARVLVRVQRQRQETLRARRGGLSVGLHVPTAGTHVDVRVLQQRRVLLVVPERVVRGVHHVPAAGVVRIRAEGACARRRGPRWHVRVGVVVADAQHDAVEAALEPVVVEIRLRDAAREEVGVADERELPVVAVGVHAVEARLLEGRGREVVVVVEVLVAVAVVRVAELVHARERRLAADDAGDLPPEACRVAERRLQPLERRAVAVEGLALLLGPRPLALVPEGVGELVLLGRDGLAPALGRRVRAVARVPAAHGARAAVLADAGLHQRERELVIGHVDAALVLVASPDAVLLLIELRVVRQDGDVDPRARRPVGIVVALLGALEAAAVAVGVLASAAHVAPPNVLVGRPEPVVALGAAVEVVVGVALVHAEAARVVGGHGTVGVVRDGVRRRVVRVVGDAIARRCHHAVILGGVAREALAALHAGVAVRRARARLGPAGRRPGIRRRARPERVERVLAGVLDDDVALHAAVRAAAVLVCPFDDHLAALVVVHARALVVDEGRDAVLVAALRPAHGAGAGVAAGGVVLGVEEPVAVVAVRVLLAVSVVAP